MRRFLGVVAVLALLITVYYFRVDIARLISGFGSGDPGTAASAQSPTADSCLLVDAPQPLTLNIGVVVDPSASTASSFSKGVMAALATQLSDHMPAKTDTPQDGVATVDAINLRVKLVGSNPYAYGAADLYVQIPGVQGLPPRPSLDCIDSTYASWTRAAKTWSTSYDAALEALSKAVDRVHSMSLKAENSGIRAALSSLVIAMPGGPGTAYLVASDYDENVAPQTAGNMGDRPLILLAACASGNATRCSSDVQKFGDWATSALHAGAISVMPSDLTASAVSQLFTEATS